MLESEAHSPFGTYRLTGVDHALYRMAQGFGRGRLRFRLGLAMRKLVLRRKRIVDATPVPVVPMALRGLWGSMFSRKGGPAFFMRPRPFSLVKLVVGKPIPPEAVTPEGLQVAVQELRGEER